MSPRQCSDQISQHCVSGLPHFVVSQSRDDGLTSAETDAVVAVAGVVATAIQTSKDYMTPHHHLSTHRELQEIADKGWSVPTHVLARIFGQSNCTLDAWGKVTHRLGFLIERTGNRDMFRVFVARDQ